MRSTFRFALILMVVFTMAIFHADLSHGGVDSRLVGTWKLVGINWDLYWVVRADGHYRLHGQDTKAQHRGILEASNDKWTLSSPQWEDGGTYELLDADTWKATGKLGTGVWKCVWYPGQPHNSGPGIGGVCDLLTPEEVSEVLDAPVKNGVSTGETDQRTGEPKEGCRIDSQFSSYDRVKIWIDTGSTTASSFERMRNDAESPIDVPGVGESAFASLSRNGVLQVKILGSESWDQNHGGMAKRGSILTISLYLKPKAALDDLPKLTELAHLMYSRYGGIEPLHIPGRSNSGISDSGNSGSREKGFFEQIEKGHKVLGEKGLAGVKSSGEKIRDVITSSQGGVSGQKSSSLPSWRSFMGGNTPSLANSGPCLVSETEIQQHLGFTVEKVYENTGDGTTEQQQSRCHFLNMQGLGEVKIIFYLRTSGSVKKGWDKKFKLYGWTRVKGIGDDAYSHYIESGQPELQAGALLGNSSLTIEWKGNSRFSTAPKPADTDKLIGLLKLAISRLN
ncbi:MAG: hypothetical protein MRK01_05520 [Candidatus Scalindua sp.]|nr:hypothetical protein [Candidatus Scalindua sp.]